VTEQARQFRIGLWAMIMACAVITLVAVISADHRWYCRHGHYETRRVAGRMDTHILIIGKTPMPMNRWIPAHDTKVWVCDEKPA